MMSDATEQAPRIDRPAVDDNVYAHSLPGAHESNWERLEEHHRNVGRRAAEFAAPFGAGPLAEAAGGLHDAGKSSPDVQAYLRRAREAFVSPSTSDGACEAQEQPRGVRQKGPDHSTAGARVAVHLYPDWRGRLIAFGIAGHHAGLMDGTGTSGRGRSLRERLDPTCYTIPVYDGWQRHAPDCPSHEDLLACTPPSSNPDFPGFEYAFLTRMVFSALVDADFLETERFYATAAGNPAPARGGTINRTHLDRLRANMAERRSDATLVNRLRGEILDHAIGRAAPPGLFTLTVPTAAA